MTLAALLPRIGASVPRMVVPTDRSHANAGLARFLVEAGVLSAADIPEVWSDALEVCARALDAWVKRQIGPLHCLSPMFLLMANEGHDRFPPQPDRAGTYASATVCWASAQEQQWVVGPGLDALERGCAGLGAAVLGALEGACLAYPLFTPDTARSIASMLYWYGEDDEEMALDEACGDDVAEREEMRGQMVTRRMVDSAYPAWALDYRRMHRGDKAFRKLARGVRTPRLCAIADDALSLSSLRFTNDYQPEIDGEFIAWGGVLTWCENDVGVRIYDDLINNAHQGDFCDRMGEVELPLESPARFARWRTDMKSRLRAIGLIDRLIHALSAPDWH